MGDFFTMISDWLNSGSYNWATDAAAYAIKNMVLVYIQKMVLIIPFAWGIAKDLMQDLQISSHINSAWSVLPSDVRSLLAFFNVPECINTIISGFVTKFVFKFIPGFK